MQRSHSYKHLQTPVMGRVLQLNKYVYQQVENVSRIIRFTYYQDILQKCCTLNAYALRMVKGKDYGKRICELGEEIIAQAHLIHGIGGWSRKVSINICAMTEDIISQAFALANGRNLSKSKDKKGDDGGN